MSTPFMQLYIGDYLRDTQGLSTEAHGAYLLILFAMWNASGWVNAEPDKMARYARLTPTRWAKIAPDVMALLTVEDGMATQGRLIKELEKASGKSLKRSQSGKLGAKAKALKQQEAQQAIATANARDLLKHSPETRNQKPESKKKEDAPAVADAIVPRETKSLTVIQTLPEWMPLEAWNGYLEMRRAKKMATSDRAVKLLINKLDAMRLKGHDPTEILDTATLGNWKSVYEPKAEGNHGHSRSAARNKNDNFLTGMFAAATEDAGESGSGEEAGDSGGFGQTRLALPSR